MHFLSGLQGRLQRHSQTSRVDQLEQQLQMLAAQTEVRHACTAAKNTSDPRV